MGQWDLEPGLNAVGSYQVSGRPFASGSINCKLGARPGGYEVVFPYVAKWFKVINNGTDACKVAFSVSGMTGSFNYFTVSKFSNGVSGDSGTLEIKASAIWISGSTDVDVVAGLTSISSRLTTTDAGTNWSGSVGVG
jgi:hypothetical protein